MPTPSISAVADAIEASLKAVGVAAGRVYHINPPTSATGADSSVVIRVAKGAASRKLGGVADWSTDFVLRVKARYGVNNARAHEPISALAAAVHDRLVVADPTLGGAVGMVEPLGFAFDFNDPEQAAAVADVSVRVMYRTNGSL